MPETINLVVTENDLPIIGDALGNLPYKQVAGLIARLNAQLAPKPAHKDGMAEAPAQDDASSVNPS